MATLRSTVYVKDPESHQTVVLEAGSSPEPRLAALVTNPSAWEGGKLPAAATKSADSSPSSDDGERDGDKPAAKRAAKRPARGRSAAGEGDSGD
ncbi:hypothetical protein ACTWJ9_33580 (plasmid) [Streptomyces sp. GDS52]|uniref:hypothetical protein n=1 Tax=Streptomyces sp. GDS52 TaxID=3406419 RepID=UPI003FCF9A1F